MRSQREQLVLIGAFAAAIALHAAVLPFVGAAVGRGGVPGPGDLRVVSVEAPGFAVADGDLEFTALLHYEPADAQTMAVQLPRRIDRLTLSRDRQIDEADPVLVSRPHTAVPGILRDGRFNLQASIPAQADGPYWLIYHADADGRVPDRDRSNNTYARPVYIDGPQTPELAINAFNAPAQATPGGAVLIDFTVQNIGEGWAANRDTLGHDAAAPHWADRVYLSVDDKLDVSDLPLRSLERSTPLRPGDAYRRERIEITLPRGLTGKMHLILAADADQVLDQPSFTAGVAVRPVRLVQTGAPDLVVASITTPDRLVLGRPAPIAFSVANLGGVPTDAGGWSDAVYLAPEPVLDERAVPLMRTNPDQLVRPLGRYASSFELELDEPIEPGEWYLVVKTDAGEAIDERGFDDNNTLAVPVTVQTPEQADAEIQLGDPDRPERLVVQWIEHDRLEEHRARPSRTTQPAIQDKADPVPDAPLIFDPQPPAVASQANTNSGDPTPPTPQQDPTQQRDARPIPAAPDATRTDLAPRPQQPGSQNSPRIDGLPGDAGDANPRRPGIDPPTLPVEPRPLDPTPSDQDHPSPLPGDRDVESTADPDAPDTDRTTDSNTPADQESDTDSDNPNPTDTKDPADRRDDSEADRPSDNPDADPPSERDGEGDADEPAPEKSTDKPPSDAQSPRPEGRPDDPAKPSEEQTPTRAPRDDSEAPPVSVEKIEVALQEGRVLVGKGIKVTTKLPIPPGTGVREFDLPHNARVRVTFNSDGKVHEAKVIRSTRSAAWDAAIEASLYRWSARGDAVQQANPHITIEWNYIMNDLLDSE